MLYSITQLYMLFLIILHIYYLIKMKITLLIIATSLIVLVVNDCAFIVNNTLYPNDPTEQTVHGFTVEEANCQSYIGKTGCCNHNSFLQTTNSFRQIDTVFGSSGGGCDICAVNLKRFWCQFSCNPNQSNYVKTYDYIQVPSFSIPGKLVWAQKVVLTIQTETACKLFDSCKRTPYAAQLSATQTPAGFLTFQGANAIEDAFQFIEIQFSDDKTQGLYLPDQDNCSFKLPTPPETYYGYEVTKNCTCNSCQSECSGINYYQQTGVMQGFNYKLVIGVWSGVIGITIVLTLIRLRKKNKQE